MSRSVMLALLLGLGSAGCGNDPLAPLTDRYTLISIAADPLPAVFMANGGTTVTIVESRLEFTTANRGVEHQRTRVTTTTDPTGVESAHTSEFTYLMNGGRIEITYDCPDLADCIAGPHLIGHLVNGQLIFDVSLGRTPMVYRPD